MATHTAGDAVSHRTRRTSVVHCDWLKHSWPPTHQVMQSVTGLVAPSYLICVFLSKAQCENQSGFACGIHANQAQLLES